MGKDFQLRCYSLTELAQLYRPNLTPKSAAKTLKNWIRNHPALLRELERCGYRPHSVHSLTPLQVAVIVKFLGEP